MFFEGRTLKRRRLWTLAACALLAGASGLWLAAPGKAGTRLERPITIVVTFPPGGGTDLLARRLGEQLQQRLGQPVVVEEPARRQRQHRRPCRGPGPQRTAAPC